MKLRTVIVALAATILLASGEALAADFFFDVGDIPFRLRLHGSLRLSANFIDDAWTLGMTNAPDGPFPGSSRRENVRQFGLQYEIPIELTSGDNFEFFLRLQRLGRADYAPIIESNRYVTLFGEVPTYDADELLPRIRTFYFDIPLVDPGLPVRARAGLIPYVVGGGYALGGKYDQYGVDVYNREGPIRARLHYDKPDLISGMYLGIQRPEAERGTKDDAEGHFVAGDAAHTATVGPLVINTQAYVGLLRDETRAGSRRVGKTRRATPLFSGTDTDLDHLWTAGLAARFQFADLVVGVEGARNFGEAESRVAGVPDIDHAGWMLTTDAAYSLGVVTPRARFLYTSSNSFSRSDLARFFGNPAGGAKDVLFKPRQHNRAFSVYSPTNEKFFDSHYWKALGPLVATAAGYGVNFGIPRPGTFGDPHILENLMMTNVGVDVVPTPKWTFALDYYYMRAVEAGFGIPPNLNNPADFTTQILHEKARPLSPDLGHEIDISAKYKLHKHVTLGLQTGVFLPGEYYREPRHPTDVSAAPFSKTVLGFRQGDCKSTSKGPCARAIRDPDPAYEIELGVEFAF